jgi:hypothetical protein
MSILGLLAILLVLAGKPADAEEQGSSLLDERKMIMALNFADENSCLLANGDLIDGETRPRNTVYGKMPRARFEGTVPGGNPVGPESVMLVPSFSRETGRAIRYALGPQATSGKARSEHYLHVGEFNRTYCSEFSMMLDPNMTIAEKTTEHDGGSNWVILRQWHQSAPESPPIALMLEGGTNNVIVTSIRYGDRKGAESQKFRGRNTLKPGKWYHFRYQWHIAPGSDNGRLKVWLSDQRWGDNLRETDVLFDYHGPIGYTLNGKPESEVSSHSNSIREQQGIYQGAHLAKTSFHAVSIANVRIYQMP